MFCMCYVLSSAVVVLFGFGFGFVLVFRGL